MTSCGVSFDKLNNWDSIRDDNAVTSSVTSCVTSSDSLSSEEGKIIKKEDFILVIGIHLGQSRSFGQSQMGYVKYD